MEIIKERFEDAGDIDDEDGSYSFYYAGFHMTFTEGKEAFFIRQYEDEPEKAAFMSYSIKQEKEWKGFNFVTIPYENPLFCKIVRHLIEQEGISKVQVFTKNYIKVDIKRASATK